MKIERKSFEGPVGSDNVVNEQASAKADLEVYIASLPVGDDRERNRGLLIQCLHRAQSLFGYLPESVQLFVADRLNLHLSEVYGVVSFYSYFTETPVGRYQIHVCTGTACFVKGAEQVLEAFRQHLGIEEGQTSENGMFSLGALRCVGACSLAPVVTVNDKVYGKVSPKMVLDIIGECG